MRHHVVGPARLGGMRKRRLWVDELTIAAENQQQRRMSYD